MSKLTSTIFRVLNRKRAKERTKQLFEESFSLNEEENAPLKIEKQTTSEELSDLAELLQQAKVNLSERHFILLAIIIPLFFTIWASKIISPFLLPVIFLSLVGLLFSWLDQRSIKRAMEFAQDYPTVLLAMSSSLKIGLTPYNALERAIKFLPANSLPRVETETFLEKIRRGISRDVALKEFGATIRLPELELFRSAFSLVLENGGRFSPTLERLANITKDRVTLIGSARVSTASMRMTGNVSLVFAPIIVLLTSGRNKDYWELMLSHPVANLVASVGLLFIFGGYGVLRKMSLFKP
jgi:Flp pilus assembly protein TadB